jgi:hypothetical protein
LPQSIKAVESRPQGKIMAKAKKASKSNSKTPAATSQAYDPALAAAAAAALVGNKISASSPASGQNTGESTSFKNLKDSLSKPHLQNIGGLLDKTGGPNPKKNSAATGGVDQVKHNQTFGADVSRRSVPRRTGG